jgi:hypothetical protein
MPDTTDPPSTPAQRPAGLERRQIDRTPPPPPRIIGEARVRPEHTRLEIAMDPQSWYPVLDRNPKALEPIARPAYLWIAVHGRPLHLRAAHFELHANPEEPR